ncbi:MAG TPA: class II aldolase/adducin family protein [Candidatus Dormibacteraeota bacterium]|nr:class II aldolase/adducin family protein [Candidatus Dormibacteraeota bacterium]
MDEGSLRAALVAAGRRLAAHGLVVGAEGTLSVRLDAGTLLVTPSGRRKDELGGGDLLVVPLDATRASMAPGASAARPSSDIAIHRAIYEARSDVAAVAHAHVPASMALTLVGEEPDPAVLPETALLLPRLPVVPFGAPGSRELAALVATAFTAPPEPHADAVLLERHGAIAVGASIESAVDRLDLVDVLCRVWRDARLLAPSRRPGPPVPAP